MANEVQGVILTSTEIKVEKHKKKETNNVKGNKDGNEPTNGFNTLLGDWDWLGSGLVNQTGWRSLSFIDDRSSRETRANMLSRFPESLAWVKSKLMGPGVKVKEYAWGLSKAAPPVGTSSSLPQTNIQADGMQGLPLNKLNNIWGKQRRLTFSHLWTKHRRFFCAYRTTGKY